MTKSDREIAEYLDPKATEHPTTLTLELMLEGLYEKKLGFEFDPLDYTGKANRYVSIYKYTESEFSYQEDNYFSCEGETLTLALRGAIIKLMEEEEKDAS